MATSRNRAIWSSQSAASSELEMLERPHLDALRADAQIRDALKTEELRELIRCIDGSKCRLEALAAAQHNVPQFKRFCEQVLGVVYTTEDARHRYNRA